MGEPSKPPMSPPEDHAPRPETQPPDQPAPAETFAWQWLPPPTLPTLPTTERRSAKPPVPPAVPSPLLPSNQPVAEKLMTAAILSQPVLIACSTAKTLPARTSPT